MNSLGQQLWQAIETAQGYAFISDSVEDMADTEVLHIAIAAYFHTLSCLDILKRFVDENESVIATVHTLPQLAEIMPPVIRPEFSVDYSDGV